MTSEDPDGPWAFDDPWTMTHPDHPLIDDHSAAVLEDATVELTLVRSPMHLGDGLADLHAMVSLQAQLQAWIPLAVATARNQGHSWAEIASQLRVRPATARRRHQVHRTAPWAPHNGGPPSYNEAGDPPPQQASGPAR